MKSHDHQIRLQHRMFEGPTRRRARRLESAKTAAICVLGVVFALGFGFLMAYPVILKLEFLSAATQYLQSHTP